MSINIFNKKPEQPKNKVGFVPSAQPEKVAPKKKSKKPNNPSSAKSKAKGTVDRWLSKIFDGDFLTKEIVVKQLPFIGFVALLFILNIAWVYYFENTARETEQLKREVGEMSSEYQTNISNLESKRRQTQVAKDAATLGLEETDEPPIVIE